LKKASSLGLGLTKIVWQFGHSSYENPCFLKTKSPTQRQAGQQILIFAPPAKYLVASNAASRRYSSNMACGRISSSFRTFF
jgi:hypothetical protein